MKRTISFILSAVLILTVLTSCSTESKEEFEGVELLEWGEVNSLGYFDLESLEKACDIIAVGSFVGDAKQEDVYKYNDQFGKDVLFSTKSYSSMKISKVIKGDVEVGDTLTVSQNYGVVDDKLITCSELTPMLDGDTWLFFLYNNYDSGIYCYAGDSDGRYPVKDFTYQRIALTENEALGVYEKENFNQAIYDEILEKYDF